MKKLLIILLISSSSLFAQLENSNSVLTQNLLNKITVTIGGEFIVTGSFPALKTERVDEFVTRIANQVLLSPTNALTQSFLKSDYAVRGIKLIRRSGEKLIIDLQKFRLTGDFKFNPYLKNDDVLVFPKVDKSKNYISVEGAVSRRIVFQYQEGDKLGDALIFAQGIKPAYENVEFLEISRLSYQGDDEEVITLPIDSVNFPLEVGDRIFVKGETPARYRFKIYIIGEVNYQGFVPIAKNSTTLKEVINRVGGFKLTASLENATLTRNNSNLDILTKTGLQIYINQQNLKKVFPSDKVLYDTLQALRMKRLANLTREEIPWFEVENKLRMMQKNNEVDFTKIYTDSSVANFIVKDGDIIIVPEKTSLVYVWGQVLNPGYYNHKDGADFEYYVKLAGGRGVTAQDEGYVIKSKSQSWIEQEDSPTIEPGDYIYIPKDPPRNFNYYLGQVGSIAGIVGSIMTTVLLVYQLTK